MGGCTEIGGDHGRGGVSTTAGRSLPPNHALQLTRPATSVSGLHGALHAGRAAERRRQAAEGRGMSKALCLAGMVCAVLTAAAVVWAAVGAAEARPLTFMLATLIAACGLSFTLV